MTHSIGRTAPSVQADGAAASICAVRLVAASDDGNAREDCSKETVIHSSTLPDLLTKSQCPLPTHCGHSATMPYLAGASSVLMSDVIQEEVACAGAQWRTMVSTSVYDRRTEE